MPANEVKIKNCAAFFTFSLVATIGKGDFPYLMYFLQTVYIMLR